MLRGNVITRWAGPAAVAVLRCSITLDIIQVKAEGGGSGAGSGGFPNPDTDAVRPIAYPGTDRVKGKEEKEEKA